MQEKETKIINITDLEVGMIAHFYGARFLITSTKMVSGQATKGLDFDASDLVMRANGKWLDGEIEKGYFGPEQDWVFQGNFRVYVSVEK